MVSSCGVGTICCHVVQIVFVETFNAKTREELTAYGQHWVTFIVQDRLCTVTIYLRGDVSIWHVVCCTARRSRFPRRVYVLTRRTLTFCTHVFCIPPPTQSHILCTVRKYGVCFLLCFTCRATAIQIFLNKRKHIHTYTQTYIINTTRYYLSEKKGKKQTPSANGFAGTHTFSTGRTSTQCQTLARPHAQVESCTK